MKFDELVEKYPSNEPGDNFDIDDLLIDLKSNVEKLKMCWKTIDVENSVYMFKTELYQLIKNTMKLKEIADNEPRLK